MSIRLEDLKVSFAMSGSGTVDVLDIPSLDVPEGKPLCLVGGSGSGKTTLLNVVAGIVPPTSGRVLHGDVDIARLSEAARDRFRAESIGYVFQTFNLLQGLTARENVMIALAFAGTHGKPARTRSDELLERMRLTHRADARPGTMSVGEQQRVALARAVANRPRVVLADEPTANLDEENGDEVLDLLQETTSDEGSVLLLVTHETRVQARFERTLPLTEVSRTASTNGAAR